MSAPECEICYEEFNHFSRLPIVGSCGHTYCAQCILQLPDTKCPTCRDRRAFRHPVQNFSLLEMIEMTEDDEAEFQFEDEEEEEIGLGGVAEEEDEDDFYTLEEILERAHENPSPALFLEDSSSEYSHAPSPLPPSPLPPRQNGFPAPQFPPTDLPRLQYVHPTPVPIQAFAPPMPMQTFHLVATVQPTPVFPSPLVLAQMQNPWSNYHSATYYAPMWTPQPPYNGQGFWNGMM